MRDAFVRENYDLVLKRAHNAWKEAWGSDKIARPSYSGRFYLRPRYGIARHLSTHIPRLGKHRSDIFGAAPWAASFTMRSIWVAIPFRLPSTPRFLLYIAKPSLSSSVDKLCLHYTNFLLSHIFLFAGISFLRRHRSSCLFFFVDEYVCVCVLAKWKAENFSVVWSASAGDWSWCLSWTD